jgi:hypothetical protein
VAEHTIDLDADPFVPVPWTVETHRKGGQLEWNPDTVTLFLTPYQRFVGGVRGEALLEEIAHKPVINANMLDWLLAHPHLIPESWEWNDVVFWGTIYSDRDGRLYVRYLHLCAFGLWIWFYLELKYDFYDGFPAAVLVE